MQRDLLELVKFVHHIAICLRKSQIPTEYNRTKDVQYSVSFDLYLSQCIETELMFPIAKRMLFRIFRNASADCARDRWA